MNTFYNKVIWITGASSGIGEALAYEMAGKGAKLALSARRAEKLNSIREKCIAMGAEAEIFPFDLSKEEEIPRIVTKVLDYFKQVHLLVNNGGISQRSLVQDTGLEIDRKIMDINYFGNIALAKALIPSMLEYGEGHIAVTTSIVGKFGFPLRSAYSASKHALYGFYESLRTELPEIDITLIAPGRIQTDISLHALNKEGNEQGIMDAGQAQGMPAEKCARIILRGLKKKKREILVGEKELWMVYIKKFSPSLFYYITRHIDQE